MKANVTPSLKKFQNKNFLIDKFAENGRHEVGP
jgi:hypothetical protein